MDQSKDTFRERAGVITAFVVVLCFIGLGFVQFFTFTYKGVTITFDSDWKISLYGMASIAFGFLIGSKNNQQQNAGGGSSVNVDSPDKVTINSSAAAPTTNPVNTAITHPGGK